MVLFHREDGCMILIYKIITETLLNIYYNVNFYQYHIIGTIII